MEICNAASCKKNILQGWILGYYKYYFLSYEKLCLLNSFICTYEYPKISINQEFCKFPYFFKNIIYKVIKYILKPANILEWNIFAKKKVWAKKNMRRIFMQDICLLIIFNGSLDFLLQSHFLISLRAPIGSPTNIAY